MSTAIESHVRLPQTNRLVYTQRGYRVPKTNYTLNSIGFINEERDLLFQLYGKNTILTALAVYFGALRNTHRDENSYDNGELRTGLVATMESIRTRGRKLTEDAIFGNENIVDIIKGKYADRGPVISTKEGDGFKQALLAHFIGFYIKGGNTPTSNGS